MNGYFSISATCSRAGLIWTGCDQLRNERPQSEHPALPLARPLLSASLATTLSRLGQQCPKDEYREKQEAKKSRRKVDVADNLFEQLEIPSITRVEGQKLYDRRRLEILSDKALSPDAKAEELKRIEKDCRDWLQKHNFSIFEEED